MSAQTDVLDQLTERWARDDRAGVEELVHPDVEIDMTVRVMNPEVYRGYEGLWRYAEDVTELWEYGEPEIHRCLERGDEVLAVRTTLLTDVDRAIADFEKGRPAHTPAE